MTLIRICWAIILVSFLIPNKFLVSLAKEGTFKYFFIITIVGFVCTIYVIFYEFRHWYRFRWSFKSIDWKNIWFFCLLSFPLFLIGPFVYYVFVIELQITINKMAEKQEERMDYIKKFIGSIVREIIFIHDNVQIKFLNDIRLTINTKYQLCPEHLSLNSIIDKEVVSVKQTKDCFEIQFDCGDNTVSLIIDLFPPSPRPDDLIAPEAMILDIPGMPLIVWNIAA